MIYRKRDENGGQQNGNAHVDQPQQPQESAVLPAQGGIVRRVEKMQETGGQGQGLGRVFHQQHDLPFVEEAHRPVGPFRRHSLGQQGEGAVFDQLLQHAQAGHVIHVAARDPPARFFYVFPAGNTV